MPLAQAIAKEGAASSSSFEEEIDRFRFEEEAIVISEAEEEADEYLCVQTPAPIITYVGDFSNNEEEELAPKTGPSLRERKEQGAFSSRKNQVQAFSESSLSSSASC